MTNSLLTINYEDIISEKIIEVLVEKGINGIKQLFKNETSNLEERAKKGLNEDDFEFFIDNYNLEISEKTVLKFISHNIQTANIWSNEVNFSTAISSKELQSIFIEIDLYLSPLKYRFDVEEMTDKINSKELLNDFSRNKIIYGGAGAGKTTLIKKIYTEFTKSNLKNDFVCPIMIRFRELDYENHISIESFGLFKILVDILGIQIKFPKKHIETFKYEYYNLLKQTVISFLDDSKILLIADGFDEIPDNDLKKRIEKEFQELALSLKSSRFILTSRSNDFLLKLNNTDTYEICPLNDEQIKLLINRWIINIQKSEDLFQKIKSSPYYDTTMRPLTLSHLCAIYERKKTIPPKPRYVYDFVLNLLLEAWDQQRNVVRPSKYADFYIEKKKEFLSHLSYWLSYHLSKNVFNSDDIRKCYNNIYMTHNLPISQAKKVVIELENHTGVFAQTGYDSYEFSHKSLQEFLTAKYISALPKVPESIILNKLPNETAISICLSSSPNYYFEILNKNFKQYDEYFWSVFLNRLTEEKPDFSNDSSVIVFFLNHIYENDNDIFKKTFIKLMKDTNLRITLKSFFNDYKRSGESNSQTTYLHKNIKTPLKERNYYPSKLYSDKEITSLIKNYT